MIEILIVGSNKPGIIHFDNSNLIPDANYRIVSQSAWDDFNSVLGQHEMSLQKTCLNRLYLISDSTTVRRLFKHEDFILFNNYLTKLQKYPELNYLESRLKWAIDCYQKLKNMKAGEVWIEFSPQ